MVVPVNEPLSAANPHAAGVWYVPPVSCVPEIVALPIEVAVPREPASVSVYEMVCPDIVDPTESSPRTPLSHSPPRPVNAPGTPWIRTVLDLSAVTVEPLCVKLASTRMLLAGFTFECATICHWPLTLAVVDVGIGATGAGEVDAPPPHPARPRTQTDSATRCETETRRSFIGLSLRRS